ncbi:peptidoglycan DD-metalloendopeptidase family protein [Chitinibacter sp. GC72]|uniref:peptidoglycan DD-metalloendopeptidase family protein n=1 Tax=Chitinibacter sp. GC72 TaxID=1526917 RepID=UPI001E55BC26|nr:peptidoglycan DD-metalloendopeptidase family protein [Chitinibacter sp. GC72]
MSPRLFSCCIALMVLLGTGLSGCGSTGSGSGSTRVAPGFYRVQTGDTLYRIARAHNQSVANLKSWNQLSDNQIVVGQLLRVRADGASKQPVPVSSKPPASKPTASATPAPKVSLSLVWPHAGNLVGKYAPPRNKGIDIAGKEGDPVLVAADGKVVYAGDGIRAYGNMVIVRHAGDYLTTYAHNQVLLVAEGAQVRQGQPIARMGKSGTDTVKLHFELRFKGQPTNPLVQLPER